MGSVEVRVLGGVGLWVDGEPVRLPPRLSLLLGLLAAGGDLGVESDVLVEQLYAGNPPPTAAAAIRVHLTKLRDALEPGRDRAVSTRVARMPGRWRLRLEPDESDARLFTAEAGQGRALLSQGEPAQAARLLQAALDRWAEPYAGLTCALFDSDRAVLHRLYREAARDLAAAHLAEGDHVAALTVATELQRDEPWDEDVVLLRARATYSGAGQERALALLRDFTAALDDDLGLDPSPRIREAEEAVLRHDPSWAPTTPSSQVMAQSQAPTPSRLVGRDRLLQDLAQRLANGQSVLLQGDGGIGKTALLRELHRGSEETLLVSAAAAGAPYSLLLELLAAHPSAIDDPDRHLLREQVSSTGEPDDVEILAEDLAERHLKAPMVLLVDDGEALDPQSARVLGKLTGRGVRLVQARRPGRQPLVGESGPPSVSVEVGPLTPDETRQLAARLRPGTELDDDQIAAIGGVPLLVEYAVQSDLGLEGLGERLLLPLDESARAGACALAVVGAPVSVESASRLVGSDTVEDLLVARVLRVTGDWVRLAHPRLEAALRSRLGFVGCARTLAEVLEGGWEVSPLLLTEAVEQFGSGVPPALLEPWSLAAGRLSLAHGDLEGAADLFVRACESTDPAISLDGRIGRARALTGTGRLIDARLLLVPVMDELRMAGQDVELAGCLDDYSGLLRLEGGEMHVVERHARWLLDRNALTKDQRVGVLDALTRASSDEELPRRTEELLAECDQAGTPYSRFCALEARWRLSHYSGEVPVARTQAAWEGVVLAEQFSDTQLEVRMVRHLIDDLVALAWGDEVEKRLARLEELSRQHHHAQARWWVELLRVDAELRRGNLQSGLVAAQDAYDRWPRVPEPLRANFRMLQTFTGLFQLGDYDGLLAALTQVQHGPESLWVPDLVPELAAMMVGALSGDLNRDRVNSGVARVLAAPAGWRRCAELTLAGRAAVAVELPSPELRSALTVYDRCWATFGPAVASFGPIATVIAGLADLEGETAHAELMRSHARMRSTAMAAPWWFDEVSTGRRGGEVDT